MNVKNANWTALFAANFFGVFNDNFLKHCIVFIAVAWALPDWLSQAQLVSLISAALVLPYILFSPLAGHWASRYSKQRIFRIFKLIELLIMLMASVAFWFEWVWLAVFSVLIMGFQSCLYSPAKYGLIRDVGGERGVSFGSGVFETMAFLGILFGTVAASLLSDHYRFWILVLLFMGLALLGYFSAARLRVQESQEQVGGMSVINPFRFVVQSFRLAKAHKGVNAGVLGASIFWLLGGLVQMNLVIHCVQTLETSNTVAGIVLSCAAVGIAMGSTVAGLLAHGRLRPAMIPIGLLGMAISLALILLFQPGVLWLSVLVFLLAFMGGIFEVPCLAMVQRAEVGRHLGQLIGYLNLITFLFVIVGSFIFSITTALSKDNSYVVFAVILLITLLTFVYYAIRYPQFFARKSLIGL